MDTVEPIEVLNSRLIDYFGIDTLSGLPMFRVVWSEDQLEKRLTNTTDAGILLLRPEVRELPKYRQWIQNKFILEQLTLIPEINKDDLPTETMSYEPLWVFEDNKGNPLPPKWEAMKMVVDTMLAARGKSSLAKYLDPDSNPEQAKENHNERLNKLQEELFGNETTTTDALTYKEGVVVPSNYVKES